MWGQRVGLTWLLYTLPRVPAPVSPGLVLPSTTATTGWLVSPWLFFWLSSQQEQLRAAKLERTLHIYFLRLMWQSPNVASYTAGTASFSKGRSLLPCRVVTATEYWLLLIGHGPHGKQGEASAGPCCNVVFGGEADRGHSLCLSL